mgnify:CR=1 FL=1|jgi:hypothetical protein
MPETLNLNYSRYRLHRYSVNFVVVTLFYQTAIDQVYFYEINLRNLLYVILVLAHFILANVFLHFLLFLALYG